MTVDTLRSLFEGAVNDQGLTLTLTGITPETHDDKHGDKKYFRQGEVIIPVEGTTFESLNLEERPHTRYLSYCRIIGPAQFPHLPKEIEIMSHAKNEYPLTQVTTASGGKLWVGQTVKEIAKMIEDARKAKMDEGMKILADQIMKKVLG